MNKVLVTGGAGFIGSNLIKKLLSLNYEVIVVDNLTTGYKDNIEEFKDSIEFYQDDITNFELMNKLIKDVDCVFHLAAMISVSDSVKNPLDCLNINVKASINIVKECMKNSVKFIFASSASVYGNDKSPVKTEDLQTIPISPYGVSKLDIELYCQFYEAEGLNFTCFRNFNVYGPKQSFDSSYAAVIPSFFNKVLNNEDLDIFGDGEQTRDFIFVEDLVNAYVFAFQEDIRGVFNLGCNQIVTIKDLAEKIINIDNFDNSKINFHPKRKADIKHSRASSQKFKSLSSWSQSVSLDEGLRRTYNYYKDNSNFKK